MALLLGLASVQAPAPRDYGPRALSPFAAAKARALLRDRLPCLGCHQLNGDGGRIGPDLSNLGARRSPAFVLGMILDPAATLPGTGMPKTPLSRSTAELIASFLAGDGKTGNGGASPAPGAPPRSPTTTPQDAAALYARYCAACHGERGRGDGYNAEFLPVPPAPHADRAFMSRRTDDRLFDGIYAGGYVLGASARMPAFGETLSRAEIRGLVHYLRELCRCQGPAWTRDPSPSPSAPSR
ncbi:MAG: c-type cytochrome [Gemmatimonadales bacterium]